MIISYCNKSPNSLKLIRYLSVEAEIRQISDFLSLPKMLRVAVFDKMKINLLIYGGWIALQNIYTRSISMI